MIKELSAGGVVVFSNTILLLKKYNGDWVLPKGRVKQGEGLNIAALREVKEESGVKAQIIQYIGNINYQYTNAKQDNLVSKTVHWYLMRTSTMNCAPQRNEGFINAKFIHIDRVLDIVRYDDEKKMICEVLKIMGSNTWR